MRGKRFISEEMQSDQGLSVSGIGIALEFTSVLGLKSLFQEVLPWRKNYFERKVKRRNEKLLKAIITRLFLVSCILVLASPQLYAAGTASALQTQKEKESYSIGYEVGRSMKTDGVEVDFNILTQGLEDAINQKEPRLKDDEMRKLIVDLRKKAREAQLRKLQEQVVQNAQESEKFLAENRKKEGVNVTGSGLQYRVLREGDGITPKPEDFVKVHYRGTFIDGKEFDSSYAKGEPARVQTDGVIKGWNEALQMMKVGSRWQLFVPPELAYGRGGLGQRIPPNKVLVFDMELLAVEKVDKTGQQAPAQAIQTRKMSITGEIAKAEHGYIIRSKRGNVLSEIYTILNPDPKVLDEFVKSEKDVPIEIRIVSGDNVNIEKINGKEYAQTAQAQAVRKMTLTGEIAKSEQGYIIRSRKGGVLSEIYTILNPNPKVLDGFVKSEKTVPIEVRIVSGDNVNIEKINGKEYRAGTP
jgi:FKBP-type peptidyl-prolyl cis-trans isomerase